MARLSFELDFEPIKRVIDTMHPEPEDADPVHEDDDWDEDDDG
jgi:hypothetical protein